MTLPLELASVTGLPSRPVSLKSGAGSGLRAKRIEGCWSWAAEKEGKKQRSSEVTRKRTKQRCRARFMASSIGEHIGGKTPRGRLRFLVNNLPPYVCNRMLQQSVIDRLVNYLIKKELVQLRREAN